jgi:hypothetical protein
MTERLRLESRQGRFCFLSTAFRMALGSTHLSIQWLLGAFTRGKEAGEWILLLTSIWCWGQEYMELYFHFPIRSQEWCLIKHRDSFIFTNIKVEPSESKLHGTQNLKTQFQGQNRREVDGSPTALAPRPIMIYCASSSHASSATTHTE